MNLCMIGLRGHHGYVLEGLPQVPEVKVVGVSSGCDDDVTPLLNKCRQLGHAPQSYVDYRAMLDEEKPDMVCIDGPFDLHAEMCIEALQRNIHVFCEKPIALTLDELSQIRTAHQKSPVHLVSMVGLRYEAAFMTAWKAVQAGAVGKIKMINARKSYRLGQRPDFYCHRATYGGTIPWVGSHALDWIYWFGGSKFKTIYANHSCQDNNNHGELEIAAQCQAVMRNGILAAASIDFLRPSTAPSHGDDRVRVAGTQGVIEVTDDTVRLINQDGVQALEVSTDRQIFVDFVRHIQQKGVALVDAEQTFDLTEACLQARESADTGRVIEL